MHQLLLSPSTLIPFLCIKSSVSHLLRCCRVLSCEQPVRSHSIVEKHSQFCFYWHDIFTGPNPTAVRVAQAPGTNTSSTFFGAVVMIDDPLTIGPDLNSKLVGQAQGLYAAAGSKKIEFLMPTGFFSKKKK